MFLRSGRRSSSKRSKRGQYHRSQTPIRTNITSRILSNGLSHMLLLIERGRRQRSMIIPTPRRTRSHRHSNSIKTRERRSIKRSLPLTNAISAHNLSRERQRQRVILTMRRSANHDNSGERSSTPSIIMRTRNTSCTRLKSNRHLTKGRNTRRRRTRRRISMLSLGTMSDRHVTTRNASRRYSRNTSRDRRRTILRVTCRTTIRGKLMVLHHQNKKRRV